MCEQFELLTHWSWMTHICVSKLTIIGSDNGLPPGRRQAIIWNQWWNIVNWTLMNKLQWNFKRNSYIFIQEKTFENVVCEMAAILSRHHCVKIYIVGQLVRPERILEGFAVLWEQLVCSVCFSWNKDKIKYILVQNWYHTCRHLLFWSVVGVLTHCVWPHEAIT